MVLLSGDGLGLAFKLINKQAHLAMLRPSILFLSFVLGSVQALAGNCLVQGGAKIGDCSNVNVGPAKPLTVRHSGEFSGVYGDVLVKAGVVANITGNTSNITVERGGKLHLSGIAASIVVYGMADIDGSAGDVTTYPGAQVVIRGIVANLYGSGKTTIAKGAIVNATYMK